MVINKIGKWHTELGLNCQDATFEDGDLKIVCDGCSEGLHSEVGAKLFTKMFKNNLERFNVGYSDTHIYFNIDRTISQIINTIGYSANDIKNYSCFTILIAYKNLYNNNFCTYSCGDGYVICEDVDGNISFKKIDNGDYPQYYSYNFLDDKYLKHYKDGVSPVLTEYSSNIVKIGVASDGIRFIADLENDDPLKKEFINILKSNKELKMKLFINRHQDIFKDDVGIAF